MRRAYSCTLYSANSFYTYPALPYSVFEFFEILRGQPRIRDNSPPLTVLLELTGEVGTHQEVAEARSRGIEGALRRLSQRTGQALFLHLSVDGEHDQHGLCRLQQELVHPV